MAEILVPLIIGLLAGLVVTFVLLRRASLSEAEGQFQTWRATELHHIRQETLHAERARLKQRVGGELAAEMEPFPFPAADARFIGHPVHFVVFDGHTEVKDRSADSLRGVVFVSVVPEGTVPPDARLVDECVRNGRVRWMTLAIPGHERPRA